MAGKGVAQEPRLDWPALMRFKRSFTAPVPANRERALREAGIEVFHGRARFVSPDTLVLGEDKLTVRHVLLANGARGIDFCTRGREGRDEKPRTDRAENSRKQDSAAEKCRIEIRHASV